MSKTAYAFNTFYMSFLKDLKKNYKPCFEKVLKKHYRALDKTSVVYIEYLSIQFENKDLSDDDINVMKNVSYKSLMEKIREEDAATMKTYFLVFKILCRVYADKDDNETINVVLERIKQVLNRDASVMLSDILDDDLVGIFTELKETCDASDDIIDIGETPAPNVPPSFESFFDNSMIGSLAKEISKEIDVKDLNITNPNDLLNFENLSNSNNVLGNVVNKVSTKIHERIASGNISQSDLIGEAMNLMGMLNMSKSMFDGAMPKKF
jgi:hypothetical protein